MNFNYFHFWKRLYAFLAFIKLETSNQLVVVVCDRNEAILLDPCLKKMKAMVDKVGLKLDGIIMSLDSIYNSKSNRKAISNRNMIPNIKLRQCDLNREGRK